MGRKWLAGGLAIGLAVLVMPSRAAAAPADEQLHLALNNALRYNLTVWLPDHAGAPIGGLAVRQQATVAYAAAVALGHGYDPTVVGLSAQDARERAESLVSGLAASHLGNGGWWGHNWQSGYWAWLTGEAARLLGVDTGRMVADEADFQATRPVRWWMARSGKVLTPGDSGADENAWDHLLPDLAARTISPRYRARATLLQRAALARPSTGMAGWNVRPDGTFPNHFTKVSPHYMAAALALTRSTGADAKAVYRALVRSYRPDGSVAGRDDWGVSVTPYLGADALGSAHWFGVHLDRVLAMQARFPDGRSYAEGENKYPGREQVVAGDLARIVSGR
jgi:hypothetical protein